jgi:hypothetical protein
VLTRSSDGKTAEERTRQVLQIATILPGQAPDRRFSIPSRRSTASIGRVESHWSTNAPASTAEEGEDQATALDVSKEQAAEKEPGTVRRLDSETNDVDVFQDAQQ